MSKEFRLILSLVLVVGLMCGVFGCFAEEAQEWTAGSIVTFGRYHQTREETDETPIEWLVLEVDEENHRALLLSKYGLAAKSYSPERREATWETSSLREWLNHDFLTVAFTAEEQSVILLTDVDNSPSQGNSAWKKTTGGINTRDRIFLLSYAEANHYLNVTTDDSNNTASRVAPTEYAIKYGAYTKDENMTEDGEAAGWWWLRSPGYFQSEGAIVDTDGALDMMTNKGNGCVRPAMWVSLE